MLQSTITSFSDLEQCFPPIRFGGNPILRHGGNGWKDSQVNDPLLVPDLQNPKRLLMFFTGMADPVATGKFAIGLATADIANPYVWTEYPENPVFGPAEKGRWDDWWIWATDCRIINNEYHLFYIGVDRTFKTYRIGLATSPNGLVWIRQNKGNPILSPSWGEIHVAYPSLIHEGNTWYMFYQWRDKKGPAGVRLATHTDGTGWDKWKKIRIPILSRGNLGTFDEKYIEGQQILKFGEDYVLLYHAFNGVRWTEGLAHSRELCAPFTKSVKNPVFTGGKADAWDGMHISTTYLYPINNRWYLFYQGTGNSGFYSYSNWDMGMAELTLPSP